MIQTVCNQLKVFIPVSWAHTRAFMDLGIDLSVQNTGLLNYILASGQLQEHFTKISSLKQVFLTEAKTSG